MTQKLLSDEELCEKLEDIAEYLRCNDMELKNELMQLINTQKRLYAESYISMLDRLGVEKCPVCTEHIIDDDMNICKACSYGVHEWCTGYTYDGEGEYPAESAYAICKTCFNSEQKARIK